MDPERLKQSLSNLIDEQIGRVFNEITFNIASVEVISPKKLLEQQRGFSKLVVGMFSALHPKTLAFNTKDIKGNALISFPWRDAHMLVDLLKDKTTDYEKILDKSELAELLKLGESLLTAYLQAINNYFRVDMIFEELKPIQTFGEFAFELLGLNLEQKFDALFLESDLGVGGTEIQGKLSLILSSQEEDLLSEGK
jgi:hypothetical protein